jgi:hypothetical protein
MVISGGDKKSPVRVCGPGDLISALIGIVGDDELDADYAPNRVATLCRFRAIVLDLNS